MSNEHTTKDSDSRTWPEKEGIVVLQTLFIAFFVFIEMTIRTGVGVLTGIAICAALYGSLRFGRPGTTYVAVVTPRWHLQHLPSS